MNLSEAIQHALSGNAILFCGAGFSFGAKQTYHSQIPIGDMLAKSMSGQLSLDPETGLEDAAEEYYEKFGPHKYYNYLKEQFISTSIEDYHLEYTRVPWIRIYTTNFDDVIEKAYEKSGLHITPYSRKNNPKGLPEEGNVVVHLNGFIHDSQPESIRSDIILSEVSYIRACCMNPPK